MNAVLASLTVVCDAAVDGTLDDASTSGRRPASRCGARVAVTVADTGNGLWVWLNEITVLMIAGLCELRPKPPTWCAVAALIHCAVSASAALEQAEGSVKEGASTHPGFHRSRCSSGRSCA